MRAHGWTQAGKLARLRAAAAKNGGTAKTGTGAKRPKANAAGAGIQHQRTLKARRQALRKAATKRQAAAALAAKRTPKKKPSSLSLPFLVFLALLPFVLIGLYLLGADYLRRREQRESRGPRKRGGASLVITRVGDR